MNSKIIILLSLFLFLSACSVMQKKLNEDDGSFRTVPIELTDFDWKRMPVDVVANPRPDEPLIWLGVVKDVMIIPKDGKIEIKWFCQHLSFADHSPHAISTRPIKARPGKGYFIVSLIIEQMTMEEAMNFKHEHTATPHYMLAGGKLDAIVEREGIQVPFLHTLKFGLGPNLAVVEQ